MAHWISTYNSDMAGNSWETHKCSGCGEEIVVRTRTVQPGGQVCYLGMPRPPKCQKCGAIMRAQG